MADEQRNGIRLERQRHLHGWSPNGVSVFGVTLVTDEEEMVRAREELLAGEPSEYVILRVNESTAGSVNRVNRLRQIIEADRFVVRTPTQGEYEALEEGIKALVSHPA